MGILINTGFDLGSSSPIDNRTVKNTIYERDALVTDGLVYENLKVYCKDTKNEYRWTGTEWETVGSSGGDLTDYYTKTEVNNDFLKKTDAASTYATKTDIETMSSIILDSEVRLDKTYSSSKIYTDIQDAIDTSKAYTLSELGKMSGASYKVVTATNEMTDEKIIYLLDNGTTFDMYIVDNGTPTKIGDTDIDLSDYYTKTELDNDFLKKVDADSKYATITTVDGKIDKANILTTLDGTVTDEQVASALLTKTELDKTNANLGEKVDYKVVVDNGTRYLEDIVTQDINTWLPNDNSSILINLKKMNNISYSNFQLLCNKKDSKNWSCIVNGAANELWKIRYIDGVRYIDEVATMDRVKDGYAKIIKNNDTDTNDAMFIAYKNRDLFGIRIYKDDDSEHELRFNASGMSYVKNGVTVWRDTSVADIPKTTITPVFPSGVVVASGGVAINYIVRNGWCNVNFAFNLASATTFSWTDIATGLPKPANSVYTVLMNEGGKINRTIAIIINSTGSVSLRVPTEITATDWWTGNISYPVAE